MYITHSLGNTHDHVILIHVLLHIKSLQISIQGAKQNEKTFVSPAGDVLCDISSGELGCEHQRSTG